MLNEFLNSKSLILCIKEQSWVLKSYKYKPVSRITKYESESDRDNFFISINLSANDIFININIK